MNDTPDSYRTTDLAQRRERGIAAYARIFDAPEENLPAAMARLAGPLFAEEVFLAAGGPAWYHPAITDRERHLVIITRSPPRASSTVTAWIATSSRRCAPESITSPSPP